MSCIEGAVTKSRWPVRDAAQQQRDLPLSEDPEVTEALVGKEIPTANAAIAILAPIPSLAPVMEQMFLAII
jgi:hypothetical protein